MGVVEDGDKAGDFVRDITERTPMGYSSSSPIDPWALRLEHIDRFFAKCRATLIERHEEYGNSAIQPVRVMSKADAVGTLCTLVDVKLARMKRGKWPPKPDSILDAVNYFALIDAELEVSGAYAVAALRAEAAAALKAGASAESEP